MASTKKVEDLFARWKNQEDVSGEFHDEYTYSGPVSNMAPLNALYDRPTLKGKALFLDWQMRFATYVKPEQFDLVKCAAVGDTVFAEFYQKATLFEQVKIDMIFVNQFVYKDDKIIEIIQSFDLASIENKFRALEAQKAKTLEQSMKLFEAFQKQDMKAMLAMNHPEIEFIVPVCQEAPWSTIYREYPKGNGGFLQWLGAFGQCFTDIESMEPARVDVLDDKTTISEWVMTGNSFGAYDDKKIISTWKHTWENGVMTKVECLDDVSLQKKQTSPAQNLAIFYQAFRAWGSGDLEGLLATCHDSYRYECPTSEIGPLCKVFKNYAGQGPSVMRAFVEGQKAAGVEFKSCVPSQVSAVKDRVYVVWQTEEVWGGKTTIKGANQWIFTFQDGKVSHIRDLTEIGKYEAAF
jgi:ketosteroid isomerase-like protein